MGAVSIDVRRKEKEYEALTLSDENVVKYLILYRSAVDVNYGASRNANIYQAGDIMDFNQELICLYVSLDDILKKIELKDKESKLLELVFEGNTISDIVNNYDYPKKTAYRIFNKIVEKVVNKNYDNWLAVMNNKDLIYKGD